MNGKEKTTRLRTSKFMGALVGAMLITALGAAPAHAASWVGPSLNCYSTWVIVGSTTTGYTSHHHWIPPGINNGFYTRSWSNGSVSRYRISHFLRHVSAVRVDTDRTLSSARRFCDT